MAKAYTRVDGATGDVERAIRELSTEGGGVANKTEIAALEAIANPAAATAPDIADKVNEIIAALQA